MRLDRFGCHFSASAPAFVGISAAAFRRRPGKVTCFKYIRLGGKLRLFRCMTQLAGSMDLSERLERLGDLWCEVMHTTTMWPIHGHYECATCGRRHQVPWAGLPVQ